VIAIIVLSLSTSFMTATTQAPSNDILEQAGEQVPTTAPQNFNLDTQGTETAPADTTP